MKTLLMCALALSLSSGVALAGDISISLSTDDSRTEMGPRHAVRDARTAITSRDGSTVLMLLDDVVAVQLTDAALARLEERKDKKEPGFFEELLTASVKLQVPDGERFVPILLAQLGVPVRSVSVTRPTLDDVFMTFTGRTIRDAESAPGSEMAAMFRGRR
jgi:hypothetical protein